MAHSRHSCRQRTPDREPVAGRPNDLASILRRRTQEFMSPKKTLLLVEDDPFDVTFVEEHLKRARAGARLMVVGDGVGVGVGVACTSNEPMSMRPFTTRSKPGPRWS